MRELDANIPVLFMTARDDFASKQRGYRVGIDDYMIKPFDLDELFLRIGALRQYFTFFLQMSFVVAIVPGGFSLRRSIMLCWPLWGSFCFGAGEELDWKGVLIENPGVCME